MSSWQEKILAEKTLAGNTLASSFVFGPYRLNFAEGHLPGPQRIGFYQERIKNGVGMLVVEDSQILPGDYPYDWALNINEPEALTAYANLYQKLTTPNCVLIGSLNHYGGQGDSSVTRRPLWAPSNVQEVNSNEVPKVMTLADINQVKQGFFAGAKFLKAAGFEGVEINAGQFSLLRQFLSPLTNQRQDQYGGSLENRAKLLLEVLQQVREVLDGSLILGLRLCGDEYAPWAGITPPQAKEIATYITSQVKLDYLAIETGSIYSVGLTHGGYGQPENYTLEVAAEIAQGTQIPLCVGGALVSPVGWQQAIEQFAFVDATRALVADPKLITKLKANLPEDIMPCILCKEGCNTNKNTNPPLSCAVNPLVGAEHKGLVFPKVTDELTLAVVGAGPAGLMGAITAMQAGAKVDLYEKQGAIGGNFRLFAQNFTHKKPQELLGYFERQLNKYAKAGKLKINLNQEFTPAKAKDYQGILLATGATYKDSLGNLTLGDILQPDFPPAKEGETLAVVDNLGNYGTVTACKVLLSKGYALVLVTQDSYLLTKLVAMGEFSPYYQEFAAKGIVEKPNCSLRKTKAGYVLVNKYTQAQEPLPRVSQVVTLAPPTPVNSLGVSLTQAGIYFVEAGDMVAPRGFGAGIYQGYYGAIQLLTCL